MHRELVRELTLAVQSQSIKKAIKLVSLLGKAASQILSYPVFLRHFINPPTTTRGRSAKTIN